MHNSISHSPLGVVIKFSKQSWEGRTSLSFFRKSNGSSDVATLQTPLQKVGWSTTYAAGDCSR